MKLKRLIKYALSKNNVLGNLFASTTITSVVLPGHGAIGFTYDTTPGSSPSTAIAYSLDTTEAFAITVGGATGYGCTVSIVGTALYNGGRRNFNINTGSTGLVELHLQRDDYSYLVSSPSGLTSGGTFSVPPYGGTFSISL